MLAIKSIFFKIKSWSFIYIHDYWKSGRGKVLLLVSISVSAVLEVARSRYDSTTEMDTLKMILLIILYLSLMV